MENEDSKIAREASFEVIEKQIQDNSPPITSETFNRLRSEGHLHEDTMKLIGSALAVEMFEIMKNKREYSESSYANN